MLYSTYGNFTKYTRNGQFLSWKRDLDHKATCLVLECIKKGGATITVTPLYSIHFLPISKNFHVFFDVFLL